MLGCFSRERGDSRMYFALAVATSWLHSWIARIPRAYARGYMLSPLSRFEKTRNINKRERGTEKSCLRIHARSHRILVTDRTVFGTVYVTQDWPATIIRLEMFKRDQFPRHLAVGAPDSSCDASSALTRSSSLAFPHVRIGESRFVLRPVVLRRLERPPLRYLFGARSVGSGRIALSDPRGFESRHA